MQKERIDKLLSHEGFGSRKDIKKLLRTCEVLVNNNRIFDPGTQISPETDEIIVDGEIINLHNHLYLMMNKIKNTVSTSKDGIHQTVFDFLDDNLRTPYLLDKLHLIGRLDIDTEGLLIFTTDGELTHKIISPKNHISKTYFCILEKEESFERKEELIQTFKNGMEIPPEDNEPSFTADSAILRWCTDEQINENLEKSSFLKQDKKITAALLTIYEGKYHQVKRMFSAVNNKVIYLKRISMGNLKLDKSLQPGTYKYLEDSDIQKLFSQDS